jgi:sugar lactone lactonase YvrE
MQRRSTGLRFCLFLCGALSACSAGHGKGTPESVGTASVAIAIVPTGVRCIQITAAGDPTVTQSFSVSAGTNTSPGSMRLTVGGLPLGAVDFSGNAYSQGCSAISFGNPAWVSNTVSTVISPTIPVDVTLEFRPNVSAGIGADFGGDAFRTVTTVAGSGAAGSKDDVGTKASFNFPEGIALDAAGHLYVADARNSTIRAIDPLTFAVTTFAGSASQVGSADGPLASARFAHPTSIAADKAGNLFVADPQNNNIRQINLSTSQVTTLAGPSGASAGQSGSTDGTDCGSARFNAPYAIAIDGTGNLYVTDSNNATIRMISSGPCKVSTLAGTAGESGNVNAAGANARFNSPSAIATDGTNLYVGDIAVVRQVVISTASVSTIAGDVMNMGGADGIGSAAHLGFIQGLAYDGKGALFMSDSGNFTVRQMVLSTAEVQTVAGMVGNSGSSDGVGPNATFGYPTGLAFDAAGHLFVADLLGETIREISP